jgi:agmatinase
MAFYYAKAGPNDARVIITGMPLDRTSSFASGSRFGPDMARLGADNIESFSPYLGRDVTDVPVHDAGNIEFCYTTAQTPLELIRATTRAARDAGRRQLALGGEHTITGPIVTELARQNPELCVVHYDAHSDLRDEYLGERVCHATAMARVLDVVPRNRLFQLGIRSFAHASEMNAPNLFPFDVLAPIRRVRDAIGSRPTYVTVDVDVLDPGVMPDVQTPQPGGCSYADLARSLAGLDGLNLVGADLVEVCPRTIQPSAGACVAAELARELVLLLAGAGPQKAASL